MVKSNIENENGKEKNLYSYKNKLQNYSNDEKQRDESFNTLYSIQRNSCLKRSFEFKPNIGFTNTTTNLGRVNDQINTFAVKYLIKKLTNPRRSFKESLMVQHVQLYFL